MKSSTYYILCGLMFSSLLYTCTPTLTTHFISSEDILAIPTSYEVDSRGRRGPCQEATNYAPDAEHPEHTPVKYIRVNFHFINSADSSTNFVGKEAEKFANGILLAANGALKQNQKMYLPNGNDTPVLPLRYKYKWVKDSSTNKKAIYFHYDDEVCKYVHRGKNRNYGDRTVIRKYGVKTDSILNVFMMSHHPDSVASKTYDPNGVGVAVGTSMKIAGPFYSGKKDWTFKGTFNHEVGHIFTLNHSWGYNDGCDDTPKNPNCFNRNAKPGCDSLTSNNVMDYNAWQAAFTPCQIGRIHKSMAKEKSRQRKLLEPTWCTLDERKNITIQDSIDWNCMKDLEGHLTIAKGGILTMRCRTSLPKGAKITVQAGGKLILENTRLHNACGDEWLGIEVETFGKEKGEVVFMGEVKLENVVHELGVGS